MKDNNSQENKNMEAQTSAVVTMTIEEFHNALVANMELINKERLKFEMRKSNAKKQLDAMRDVNDDSVRSLARERKEFQKVIDQKNFEWNERERKLRDFRRKINEDYCFEMANAKNDHSRENQALQNERHSLYERYRKSGGAIPADTQVMQPDWKRKDADDIGTEAITEVEP